VILKYGCVTLRAIELSDKDLLRSMINSPESEIMTVGWNVPISDFAQEEWIRNFRNTRSIMRWMMDLENNVTLGTVDVRDLDWKNRVCCIDYKINVEEQNRIYGDTKDAVYAVLRYVFDELGFHRVDGEILAENLFSQKVSKSMGFVQEGIRRKAVFKQGRWHDCILYGLLSEEFIRYKDGEAPWQKRRKRHSTRNK